MIMLIVVVATCSGTLTCGHPYFPIDIVVVCSWAIPATEGPLVDSQTRFYIERAICPDHRTRGVQGRSLPLFVVPHLWVKDIIPDEAVL